MNEAKAGREGKLNVQETHYSYTPQTHAPRAPFASTTCAPSVPHGSVGSMGASGARSACTSPIFVRCASPPGTAYATLRAPLRPARAPRGSTCGPRGAGGQSGPWGSTRTCSARASSVGRRGHEALMPTKGEIEKLRILPAISAILYRDSPIEDSSNLGQDSQFLNFTF